jgi:hypothetical protein
MSFSTARIVLIIAGVIWIISMLIPYSKFGVAKRHITVIKVVMTAVIFGALITYAVFTT